MNAAVPIQGLPAVTPSLSCLLVGAWTPLWDSPVNVSIILRLCRHSMYLPPPFLCHSCLGCHLDSSLGEAANPLRDAAEVCSECALPGQAYGTVRRLQPPPACAQENL